MATKTTARKLRKAPASETKLKTALIPIRVTEEEKATLQAAAEADMLDVSTWLRRLGLKAAKAQAIG